MIGDMVDRFQGRYPHDLELLQQLLFASVLSSQGDVARLIFVTTISTTGVRNDTRETWTLPRFMPEWEIDADGRSHWLVFYI
ncbi:MAG: hypothetical protein U1E70_22755 [Acetobacteraceae bacterium]